ncbi:hypothetical protein EMIT0P253_380048 [Pseudomonas sp. IT-P253]|jgi:hypothetical protein
MTSIARKSSFKDDSPDFAAGYINTFVINGADITPTPAVGLVQF